MSSYITQNNKLYSVGNSQKYGPNCSQRITFGVSIYRFTRRTNTAASQYLGIRGNRNKKKH